MDFVGLAGRIGRTRDFDSTRGSPLSLVETNPEEVGETCGIVIHGK
jgi:hypothetical protein